MKGEYLLHCEGLRKEFPILSGPLRLHSGNVVAVDGVSFTLSSGETLGIAGESGSGKSTIARLLLRLIEPTAGEIYVNVEGRTIPWLQVPEKRLRSMRPLMQMVFQHPMLSLNPRKTIGESLSEPVRWHKLAASEEALYAQMLEVLDQVGLSKEALWRYPHAFSGGQLQRICIARALLMRPALIVCDEAVSALDLSVQAQILNLLQEIQQTRQLSYLFIAHDLTLVRAFCDRALILYRGKVVEEGPVEAIFENPQHAYTRSLLEAIPGRRAERGRARAP